jgi:hypothetical protein
MSDPIPKEETQIDKQKRAQGDKKQAVAYLKHRVEELERSMAQNYAKGSFTLAAHDARRLSATMDVLGDIDLTQ